MTNQPLDLDLGVIYTGERHLMPRLLSSLAASGDGLDMRLILVDNDSADGVDAWRGVVRNTLVVRNSSRLCYAANLNRIVAASTARYVLLMNTDMYFDPPAQCLARMVEFMDARADCGVAGCRLYRGDGQYAYPARRFQTIPIIAARRFGLGRLMPGIVDRYLYRNRDIHGSFACDWVSGCFLMLRREALRAIGPFDERFVKYFEDVDLCLRMARAGWRVMFNGGTYCHHLEQRASARLFSADAWRHLRAYAYWLGKWGCRPRGVQSRVGRA
jgi:GT2 family glycosyltransferase